MGGLRREVASAFSEMMGLFHALVRLRKSNGVKEYTHIQHCGIVIRGAYYE